MRNETVARQNAAYLMSAAKWITAVAAVGGAATVLFLAIGARELVVPVFSASSLLLAMGVFTMYAGRLEMQAAKHAETVGDDVGPLQPTSRLSSPKSLQRKKSRPDRSRIFPALLGFEGRIPRRVFWAFSLTAGFAWAILDNLGDFGAVLYFALAIPCLWVALAAQAKRWHDRGKSGWMVLVTFIPLIGFVWAFVETGFLRGTVGDNHYGPDPT